MANAAVKSSSVLTFRTKGLAGFSVALTGVCACVATVVASEAVPVSSSAAIPLISQISAVAGSGHRCWLAVLGTRLCPRARPYFTRKQVGFSAPSSTLRRDTGSIGGKSARSLVQSCVVRRGRPRRWVCKRFREYVLGQADPGGPVDIPTDLRVR